MFAETYILGMVGIIPFIWWQQREEGRNLIGMFLSGLFMILWLFTNTAPLTWDTTTMFILCFTVWMCASMLWTHSRQSIQDLLTMLCCLVVFFAARRMPMNILMMMLFVPGAIFAAMCLYHYKSLKEQEKYFIFGNNNHVGAFLLIPFFVGVWLSINMSVWIAPLTIMIAAAIIANRCLGSWIGFGAGLFYLACTQTLWSMAVIPLGIAIVWMSRKRLKASIIQRMSFLIAAYYIFKKAPMAGFGLRTFRREYSAVIPEILAGDMKDLFMRISTIEAKTSHRVHNDFIEIILELGIIGFVLFMLIFTSLPWSNPLLTAAVVGFAVHGLFFFPLREAHTAFPFFALLGCIAATSAPVIAIPPVVSWVAILLICRLLYSVFVKTLGLVHYDNATKINVMPNPSTDVEKKMLKARQDFLNLAIQCDPYNNIYLTEGYYFNVFDNPEVAFQYASRCLENYDGGKVKWGVSDQYARALMRLGGFAVARMALRYALKVCPTFQQSIDLMKQLDELERTSLVPQKT